MAILFGTDGIRGIADELFTPNLCKRIGEALGFLLKNTDREKRVLIGCDTRKSCAVINEHLAHGLNLAGVEVINAGILPTPGIAYLTKKKGFDYGIVISASHNPYEYNGIKIFNSTGYKISDEEESLIEEYVLGVSSYSNKHIGKTMLCNDSYKEYLSYLISHIGSKQSNLKIVVDTANGATSFVAKELMAAIGAECHFINCTPNGENINKGCGSTFVDPLIKEVERLNADLGIAYDGDGDRVIFIDDTLNVVDGDYILAIFMDMLNNDNANKSNVLVGTVMSNLGLREFCYKNGIDFIPAKVGDRYVLEEMLKHGAKLGGEQSGHIILSDYATTGDGELSSVLLLKHMVEKGKKLSQMKGIIRKYPQYEINVKVENERKSSILESGLLKRELKEKENFLKGKGRVVVRASGTEPLIRIMTEADTEEVAKNIAEEIRDKILSLL